MGLDASVSCACFREGRIVSPVPEHTVINDDGELTLDFPKQGHEEDYARFHEWLATGAVCEHPNMEYASLRISTWGGVSNFRAALEETGWELFPTLHAYLPKANGGQLPASAAEAALEELQTFKARYISSVPALVNVETGVLEREEGFFYIVSGDYSPGTSGYIVGMDRDGVYVEVATLPPARSFRSRHFEQQLVPTEDDRSRARPEIVLRDVVSGESCVSPHLVTNPKPFQPISLRMELRVELRTQRADRFTYILETLGQILQAARETGNPVRWW
jgi:hypothetical protein